MSSDLPIACSLSAAELPARVAEIAAVGRAHLRGVERRERGAELRFESQARERLEAIVAAEAECCAFLGLTLAEHDGAIVLAIEVPEGAEPFLGDFVAAFGAPAVAA